MKNPENEKKKKAKRNFWLWKSIKLKLQTITCLNLQETLKDVYSSSAKRFKAETYSQTKIWTNMSCYFSKTKAMWKSILNHFIQEFGHAEASG